MADLQLIGLDEDGEHVLLRASDGTRFKLAIDEPLRAAVRRDRPQLEHLRSTARGTLPPREIQARIRSGLTAEQIAEAADISIDQVRRYEGPVLAEREFMVSQAQRTRVGKDQGAPDLGDLVTDRLAARKIDTSALVWDSSRPPSGPWMVQVEYPGEQGIVRAAWAFDPQARTLSALDEQSRWLSETAIPDEPVPRRHLSPVRSRVFDIEADPIEPTPDAAPVTAEAAPVAASAVEADETSRILQDLRTKRGVRQALETPEAEVQDSNEEHDQFEGFGPQQTFTFETPSLDPATEETRQNRGDDAKVGKLYSLSDGAGRKRSSAGSAASAAEAAHPPQEVAPVAEEPSSAQDNSEQVDQVPPPLERVKPGRKGRPKVPSWDEIVFGAKPE